MSSTGYTDLSSPGSAGRISSLLDAGGVSRERILLSQILVNSQICICNAVQAVEALALATGLFAIPTSGIRVSVKLCIRYL